MEGEAKEAFAAIPGLAAKDKGQPVCPRHLRQRRKLSGRITKDSFSMQPSFAAMPALGWNVINVPNGNNLQEVYLAIEKPSPLRNRIKAAGLCAGKTVKGYGIKATEENSAGRLPARQRRRSWTG